MIKFSLATVVELPNNEVIQAFSDKFSDPVDVANAEIIYYVNVLANNRPTPNEIKGLIAAVERATKLKYNIA